MNIIKITENNSDFEYNESSKALKDILLMYFEISSDCLPIGDFSRAEYGNVDPYKYLDIEYEYKYQFRSNHELKILHEGVAIKLLCILANIVDEDECSGSTVLSDFNSNIHADNEIIQKKFQVITVIHEAWNQGRIIKTPSIHHSFNIAFNDEQKFYNSLESVRKEVIMNVFELKTSCEQNDV